MSIGTQPLQKVSWSWMKQAVAAGAVLCLAGNVQASSECAPTVWESGEHSNLKSQLGTAISSPSGADATSPLATVTGTGTGTANGSSGLVASPSTAVVPVSISSLLCSGNVTAGEINCRYTTNTEDMELNYHTCTALANKYGITIEKFFKLNPTVHPNRSEEHTSELQSHS